MKLSGTLSLSDNNQTGVKFDSPSRCFTMPLRLFPWAAMSTRFPRLICGAITSFQNGSARAIVSLRLSQLGSCSWVRSA